MTTPASRDNDEQCPKNKSSSPAISYRLDILLTLCDAKAKVPDDLAAWDVITPTGKEVIEESAPY